MADPTLTSALSGLEFAPIETGWGIGAQGVAQALPALQNPYASPLQNLGVTLGGALVASLLGYQARKEAFDLGLQSQNYANQMMAMQTPQERTAFLETLPSDAISSGVGSRLSTLSTALGQQEALQKALIGQKIAEQEALAKFQLGDLGQQLEKNKMRQAALVAGIQAGNIPADFADMFATPSMEGVPMIPGLTPKQSQELYKEQLKTKAAQEGSEGAKLQRAAVATVEDLEKTFRDLGMTAAEFKVASSIPGTKAELAYSKLKGSLAALARVSGQTSQLSDTDLRQQLEAIIGPKAPFIGGISGTDSIADRIKEKLKVGEEIRGSAGSTTPGGKSPAELRNEELKARLKRLEELAAQRK